MAARAPGEGGRFRRCLEGHGNTVSGLAACADGKLVSGSWDCTVRIWNTANGARCAGTVAPPNRCRPSASEFFVSCTSKGHCLMISAD